MSKRFYISKNPYGEDYELYKKKYITMHKGLTILVGCNGMGKTTLLQTIESKLKDGNIPVLFFNNLTQGGSRNVSDFLYNGNDAMAALSICSSEGENIIISIGNILKKINEFISTGRYYKSKFDKVFDGIIDKPKEEISSKERWILFDAVDSGLSVDNIIDLKSILHKIMDKYQDDYDLYIIISANEYELARKEDCFDVYNGKYIEFEDYEDYRNMIIESRAIKEKRYEKDGN